MGGRRGEGWGGEKRGGLTLSDLIYGSPNHIKKSLKTFNFIFVPLRTIKENRGLKTLSLKRLKSPMGTLV